MQCHVNRVSTCCAGLARTNSVYWSGKGAASGSGEAALDRALADPDWVKQQLKRLRTPGPSRRRSEFATPCSRLNLEASWAVCADKTDALYLESRAEVLLRPNGLWNG